MDPLPCKNAQTYQLSKKRPISQRSTNLSVKNTMKPKSTTSKCLLKLRRTFMRMILQKLTWKIIDPNQFNWEHWRNPAKQEQRLPRLKNSWKRTKPINRSHNSWENETVLLVTDGGMESWGKMMLTLSRHRSSMRAQSKPKSLHKLKKTWLTNAEISVSYISYHSFLTCRNRSWHGY